MFVARVCATRVCVACSLLRADSMLGLEVARHETLDNSPHGFLSLKECRYFQLLLNLLGQLLSCPVFPATK